MGKLRSGAIDPICLETIKIHPSLKDHFSYVFGKVALRLKQQVNRRFSAYGIIGPQVGILAVLKASGPTNQITLVEDMGIDKTTMVKLIDGLEQGGYVNRVVPPNDRRAKLVEVTPKGKELLRKLFVVKQQVEEEFFAPLSRSEMSQLSKLVFKLVRDRE